MSWLEPCSSHWPADHPVPHAMTSPGSSLGSGGSSTWLSEEEEPFQSYRLRNPIQHGAQSLQQGGSEGQIGGVPSCTFFFSYLESSYCHRDERKDTQCPGPPWGCSQQLPVRQRRPSLTLTMFLHKCGTQQGVSPQ